MFSIKKLTRLEEQGDENAHKESGQKVFWKSIDFYKNNWSFLIFIPTAVGGFFQLFQLLSMDPSFVRFFAVEQVIPDGLLFVFLAIYCSAIAFGLKKAYLPPEEIKVGWKLGNIYKNIKGPLIISIFLVVFIIIDYCYKLDKNESVLLYLLIVSIKVVAFFLIFEVLYRLRVLYFFRGLSTEQVKYLVNNNFDELYWSFFKAKELHGILFYFLVFFGSISFIFYTVIDVYKRVTTFNNLANEKILITLVQEKIKPQTQLSIKYYNGKYIFIRSFNHVKEEFIVLKGEKLLDIIKDDK